MGVENAQTGVLINMEFQYKRECNYIYGSIPAQPARSTHLQTFTLIIKAAHNMDLVLQQ